MTDVNWTAQTSGESGGDVMLDAGQVRDLAPGTYEHLVLQRGARAVLHAGVYIIKAVSLDRGAELDIDDRGGPAQLYVRSDLDFAGTVRTATFGIPKLLVGYLGSQPVRLLQRRPPGDPISAAA
jgi:hypothetical protein